MPLLIAVLLLFFAASAQADPGRELFERGAGATVRIGDGTVEIPATRFACAGCHGEDARGGQEGATIFPALIADTSPRFSRAALAAALTEGRGADGRRLASAMPRYNADDATLDALQSYLSDLARAGRIGVTPQALRVEPPADPRLLAPFFGQLEEINRQGGVWGRTFVPAAKDDAVVSADETMLKLGQGLSAVASSDGHAQAARVGQEVIRAAIACGRAVTRRCLSDHLGAASAER